MFNYLIIINIISLLSQETTSIDYNRYSSQIYPSCPCEKGERGEKGDAGVCPTNCGWRLNTYSRDCLGTKINIERLAQSIRQLVVDTKRITYRNARTMPCICPSTSPVSTTVRPPFSLDYNMYVRMKGEKGDSGASCSSNCRSSLQSNVRVFSTVQSAIDGLYTYPDHTYVHIVNSDGRLQNVLIRIHGRLIPLQIESTHALSLSDSRIPTTLSIPKPKCTITLPCPKLHIFALGPHVRQMCNPKRPNILCSKLSDYDNLCERVSERHQLKGFYRAFMSTSTQWLANLFADVCINAKIVNMHEQILFNSFEEIFERNSPKNHILDVQGSQPQFQYWWHGSLPNGTASRDTCLDWSRHDTSLSGTASSLVDHRHGLFYSQYAWPCSISDSNLGILCIETNCDKRNYYKH